MARMDDGVRQAGSTIPIREKRIPPIAEAFGYVGGAFALTALAVLMSMFWGALGVWGRTGIAAAVALAAFFGGLEIDHLEEPAAKRLAECLLALTALAAGCAVGFLVEGYVTVSNDWAWFSGTLATALAGGVLWRRRHTWIQQLVFGGGVAAAALSLLPIIPVHGPGWGPGIVLALVGVVWGVFAVRGALLPGDAGLLLATLGILGGVELAANAGVGGDLTPWAVWLGVALSVALVWAGARYDRFVVLGTATAGSVLFVIELLSEVLHIGLGVPIALLTAGAVLLAGTAWMTPRTARAAKRAPRVVGEVAGYAGAAFLFAGIANLLGEYWDDLAIAGRIAIPALVTVAVWTCARIVERTQGDSAQRLARALFGLGAVGAGITTAMIARPLADVYAPPMPKEGYESYADPSNWATFAGALGGFVAGVVVYRLRSGAVPLFAMAGASVMAVVSGFALVATGALPYWLNGAAMMAVGLLWVALALPERVIPPWVALAVGCAALLLGPMMIATESAMGLPSWPLWMGLAIAVVMIATSIVLRRGTMLGFGAAGVVLYASRVVSMLFGGRIGAPIMLLVMGVVFIGMAVLVAVVLPRMRDRSSHDAVGPA